MEKIREILTAGLLELGIDPTKAIVCRFETYLNELQKWNKVYNLTAITDGEEIVIKHFLDSLLFLKAIPPGLSTICDVGSGGGFPGLPLAIVRPDLLISLLEPSRKKIAFLRQARRLLALKNIETLNFRAEELIDSHFDVVVTRATFSISEFLKKAGHIVKPGGIFIMNKGPKYEEEIKALTSGKSAEVITVSLPKSGISRNLVAIKN